MALPDIIIKTVDFRITPFTDIDALSILAEIDAAYKKLQIQIRCDNQNLCERVRKIVFEHAMASGKQYEITIMGGGAAVDVRKFNPPAYIWDEKNKCDVPRKEWEKTHATV